MSEPAKTVTSFSLPIVELPRPTRLSIADLLLITLGTAVAIWILEPPQAPRDTPYVLITVTMAPLYGSAIAALLLTCYRVTAAEPFTTEPGHWLLLIIATAFSGIGLATRTASLNTADGLQPRWAPFFALIALMGVCLIMISVGIIIAAVYANDHQPLRWRLVFRLMGWTLLLGVIGALFLPAGGFPLIPLLMLTSPVLLLIATLTAVMIDLWERVYRDHWHWLGVAAFAGLPIHIVLLMIAALFGG